jgi:alpha-glucosidase (family GH31 glycosyl hydrolase)
MGVNDKNGRAFGTLILNSNAQEYGFLPPTTFSYRTIGGILDFYIIEESSPEILIQTYTLLVGRPYMPPYWALGFHLSDSNYQNLDGLKQAVGRTLDAEIPLDVQYVGIDHLDDKLGFTYDKVNYNGLPEYVNEMREHRGIKFMIPLDPAISNADNYSTFENGKDGHFWITFKKSSFDSNNTVLVGKRDPYTTVVFPDFLKNSCKKWWIEEMSYHNLYKLSYDGAYLILNEPANYWEYEKSNDLDYSDYCPNNTLESPPYSTLAVRIHGSNKLLNDKTICMSAIQGENDEFYHYDVHSLYGHSQIEPSLQAIQNVTQKRGIVISRSTFISSGSNAGHLLDENFSYWYDLRTSIVHLLEFNLFGIPFVGSSVCGYYENTTPELCTRWMQLGAFYTYFRNNNGPNSVVIII